MGGLNSFKIDSSDRKEIGRTGEKVSAIGIGTWAIRDYVRAEEVLVKAVELGINLIDTAEMYGYGRAEELVGRVVKRVGRDEVFITTKMLPHHLTSREEVLRAARSALRRLGVREVDLYLIHWPNPQLGIGEQVRNFEVLIDEGLARYVGVSNFSRWELEEAVNSVRKAEVVVDQVHYSVLHREVEEELLPYAIRSGITIQAYTPLERGDVLRNECVKLVADMVGRTPAQVALNYLISMPRVTAIPKTERINHLMEIAGSMGWRLSEAEINYLRRCLEGLGMGKTS